MSGLIILPSFSQMSLASPELARTASLEPSAIPTDEDLTSWKVSEKRGTQVGVGVSVSGKNAWARMTGDFRFRMRDLDSSTTYRKLEEEYKFGAGVSAFWSWIGVSANVEANRKEITETFHELTQEQEVDGTAHFDLFVTGEYPNVQVDASAYVKILQIEDSSGNTYNMAASGNPRSNTGAQDQNGTALSQENNNSTITIG